MKIPAYDPEFYRKQSSGSYTSAQTLLPLVLDIVQPSSVADIGCGVGTWLKAAGDLGVTEIAGFDGSYVDRSQLLIPMSAFHPMEFAKPFRPPRAFDLAFCLEVAEHLPESSAESFVDSLVQFSQAILFSAAIPGQRGTFHVNEQWPSYWSELFQKRDYYFWDCLRMKIWNSEEVEPWYRQNAFLVCRSDWLKQHSVSIPGPPVSLVHPRIYEYWRTLTPTLRDVPSIIRRSLWHRVLGIRLL